MLHLTTALLLATAVVLEIKAQNETTDTSEWTDQAAADDSEIPELEESWISSLIEDMVMRRNNKVMKVQGNAAASAATAYKISDTSGNPTVTYSGFQPVDLPERIVTNTGPNIISSGSNNYYHYNNKQENKPAASNNNPEVSETDMYLLGAIEKMAYRVDMMEKRLRRTEELLQHVIEATGNTQRQDPCPVNFTRVDRGCYLFSGRQYNWKSSSLMCKSLGANLLELETADEYDQLTTYLASASYLRDGDFWTGGLNPGLLWIWSNSARPVLGERERQRSRQRLGSKPPPRPDHVVHPGAASGAAGRCLKLSRGRLSGDAHQYHAADCGERIRFICEHEENTTVRALNNYHKSLRQNTTNTDGI